MSCPNPSAHPVGVRHARETARSCSTVGSDSSPSSPAPRRSSAVGLVPGSSPAGAEPDIDDVQTRVDRLYHEAEQASERYNDTQLELKGLRRRPGGRCTPTSAGRASVWTRVQDQVEDSIVRQYQGEGLATVGEVVVSDDPRTFLSELSTMSAFNDMQTSLYGDYATELKALDIRREATGQRAAQVADAEKPARPGEGHDRQGARRGPGPAGRAQGGGAPSAAVPRRGHHPAALRRARPPAARPLRSATRMAQVGDAYVYGAAGPNAFDCSGLTMMAWAQAGVGLPHSSSAQYGSGPHVSSGDLQPGDLVFYYSPISHVGMYIGNGLIVHAANPGAGVRVAGVFSMPYFGAVRPG